MSKPEVVLCNPVRTAIGTYGGSLKDIAAPELGTIAIREVLKRSGLAAAKVRPVVWEGEAARLLPIPIERLLSRFFYFRFVADTRH